MGEINTNTWLLINDLLIDYGRKLKDVDYWSGKVVENEYITKACEAEIALKKIFEKLKTESNSSRSIDDIWEFVDDYTKHLQAVDFWSGKVKNSRYLMPAYESQSRLRTALESLDKEPGNGYGSKSKFKYRL